MEKEMAILRMIGDFAYASKRNVEREQVQNVARGLRVCTCMRGNPDPNQPASERASERRKRTATTDALFCLSDSVGHTPINHLRSVTSLLGRCVDSCVRSNLGLGFWDAKATARAILDERTRLRHEKA